MREHNVEACTCGRTHISISNPETCTNSETRCGLSDEHCFKCGDRVGRQADGGMWREPMVRRVALEWLAGKVFEFDVLFVRDHPMQLLSRPATRQELVEAALAAAEEKSDNE